MSATYCYDYGRACLPYFERELNRIGAATECACVALAFCAGRRWKIIITSFVFFAVTSSKKHDDEPANTCSTAGTTICISTTAMARVTTDTVFLAVYPEKIEREIHCRCPIRRTPVRVFVNHDRHFFSFSMYLLKFTFVLFLLRAPRREYMPISRLKY